MSATLEANSLLEQLEQVPPRNFTISDSHTLLRVAKQIKEAHADPHGLDKVFVCFDNISSREGRWLTFHIGRGVKSDGVASKDWEWYKIRYRFLDKERFVCNAAFPATTTLPIKEASYAKVKAIATKIGELLGQDCEFKPKAIHVDYPNLLVCWNDIVTEAPWISFRLDHVRSNPTKRQKPVVVLVHAYNRPEGRFAKTGGNTYKGMSVVERAAVDDRCLDLVQFLKTQGVL